MTRSELYALVWSKPMTHPAKEFGLSDVGLRKICVKHDIPTPPVGYWAKRAHGKKVRQSPLPAAKKDGPGYVHLVLRATKELPPEILSVHAAAVAQEAAPESTIVVPAEYPETLHPVAARVEKALRRAKIDDEGFAHCSKTRLPSVVIDPASLERAVRIIDTFLKAVLARGHKIAAVNGDFRIVVDDEQLALRVYEGKDRQPHEPTAAEVKVQADYDRQRERYPGLYSSKSKAWRSWNYFPSGRLSLEITDPTRYRWGGKHVVGRWHDRASKKLESYLGAAMVALVTAAALVKHRRAEEAEQARLRAEEKERREKEAARRTRAEKRRTFLIGSANDYADLQR